jgi:hypothetical protein
MAFPLGFELLEQGFGDLPQWPSCEFWFRARPTYWASSFARTLRAAQPYPIVEIRHRGEPRGFEIAVYPVARALKRIAREAFLSSALESFRQFIAASPPTPNLRDYRKAVFDPLSHKCAVERPAK